MPAMTEDISPLSTITPSTGATRSSPSTFSRDLDRRGFLRGAVVAGGGLVAATVAACTPPGAMPGWTYGPIGAPDR